MWIYIYIHIHTYPTFLDFGETLFVVKNWILIKRAIQLLVGLSQELGQIMSWKAETYCYGICLLYTSIVSRNYYFQYKSMYIHIYIYKYIYTYSNIFLENSPHLHMNVPAFFNLHCHRHGT